MTKRDKDVLEFIKGFMLEYGTTPTIREIGDGVGMYSTSSVHKHIQNLVKLGEVIPIKDRTFKYKVKGMRYVEDDNAL